VRLCFSIVELRQLEHFVVVAEQRHFTRAAELLSISQSGLSASIRALERELQTPLFVRSTRRVELTEAGRALLVEGRRTLASAAAAREAVAAVQGLLRGTLTVGAEQYVGSVDLPGLLARFRAAHPGVEVVLRQQGSACLLDDLASGQLDVAFVATAPCEMEGVELRPVATESMVVMCHPGHPLAGRARVPLDELAGETFVDFHRAWGARTISERAFAAAGVERKVALEVNDVDTLRALVSHGLGIALTPAPLACRLPAVAVEPGGIEDWQVSIATPAGEAISLAAQALVGQLPRRHRRHEHRVVDGLVDGPAAPRVVPLVHASAR
jgi:DNA-binding transcriptional LysR family regulator